MTDHRRRGDCERTPRLIDRVVDERVTADDRAHASTCATCGPVLARAARFDDDLRRSARGLVAEQLPYGVLDTSLTPQLSVGGLPVRRAAPGVASLLGAVVVLLVATTVAMLPGGLGPGESPPDSIQVRGPVFRATVDVITDLRALEYGCLPGHALPTTGPSARLGEREGVICLTPKSIDSASAAFAPVENGDGDVVEVTIRGELYGTETLRSRDQLATAMGKLTYLALADQAIAAQAGAWVEEVLPRLRVLTTGDDALMVFGDVRVELRRYIAGNYLLVLQPVQVPG